MIGDEMDGARSSGTRRIVIIGVSVAMLAVLVIGVKGIFGGGGAANAAAGGAPGGGMPPMPVDVDTARRETVVDAVRATGRIEPMQAIELRPDEQGRIVELLFQEGQSVQKGAALIKIDDAILKAQAERATADRDLTKQNLDRVRRLKAENATSAADLERAEATARSAAAALALLELQIERTTVRAPFGGVVGQRFVNVGDYVTSATNLLTLQTTDPQRAVIEVSERHAGQLRPGQTVQFSIAAQPERVFRATVEFVDPVVQNAGRTITVKARASNPSNVLKAGMFIEARLATTARPNATVIAEDAVQPLRSANVVWAVVDGKAARRVVEIGTRTRGLVEILSGVNAGDIVVVGGLERMQEGMPVAPQVRAAPSDSGASKRVDRNPK